MSKAFAVLGSALFFVVAPFTLAGLVPWWVTQWEFRPAFFGVDLTRIIGGILIIGVARDIPVLPARAADMRDVPCFMAALLGDGDQADAEAFVDQKPHDTAIVSSRRRPRRTGC